MRKAVKELEVKSKTCKNSPRHTSPSFPAIDPMLSLAGRCLPDCDAPRRAP